MNLSENILENKKHIHFIGAGGSGMYPLAQILVSKGFHVTGSDNNETETLNAARKAGVEILPIGQRAENIEGADLIVYTSAVMEDNPELIAARKSGVPILERAEMLGIISASFNNSVCVSGTHGKTTVTSMITQILLDAGIDISAYIGGKLPIIGGSGRVGTSETFVCESCEFRDHFLKLSPNIAVILNIDEDHLDYFKNLSNIKSSFRKFAEKSKTVVANGSDKNTLDALEGMNIITFGKDESCNFYPTDINYVNGFLTEFSVYKDKELFTHVKLHIPGRHNVYNAVAAACAAFYSGASADDISRGLEHFRGAGRRFEKYGEECGVTVVDDYAHHPAEIAAVLTAAKGLDYKNVWALFQPFTFSRTALLLDDFVKALKIADKCVITSIMGGRENNDYDIHTKSLAELIDGAVYFDEEEHDKNFELVTDYVAENAQAGDLVVTLGCGDVNKAARLLLKKLSEKSKSEGF